MYARNPVPTVTRPLAALSLAALAVLTPIQSSAVAEPEERYAAIVVDAGSGEILFARHADKRRFPASITKVMTLYLVFEALESGRIRKDEMITVSAHAAAQPPSKLGLAAGRRISVDSAIRSLAVHSSNDMAVALAEHVGGSESRFAEQMTRKARDLGMTRTRFVNPHGLPDSRHTSSAQDIAILSVAVRRDFPQYYSYFGQRRWTWEGRTYNNTNGLLHSMAGVDGLKTGFTRASGYNLTASASRDGRSLITVVLGGRSGQTRNAHVATLIRSGFEAQRIRSGGGSLDESRRAFPDPSDNAPQVLPVETADNPPSAAAGAEGSRSGAATWRIQVGAFRDEATARDWLRQVGRRFPGQVGEAQGSLVQNAAGWHQARYAGFTREAAAAACAVLETNRVPCLVVTPPAG